MKLLTEAVTAPPRRAAETLSAPELLNAFVSGTLEQEAFLNGAGELLKRAPDAGWELLALIDQYYRRGKIDAPVFNTLKTRLHNTLMGSVGTGDVSMPLRHAQAETQSDERVGSTPSGVPATRMAAGTPQRPSAASPLAAPSPLSAATTRPVAAAAPVAMPPRPSAPRAAAVAPSLRPPHDTGTVLPTDTAKTAPQPQNLPAVGEVLRGRYRIVAMLGQGGMGTVFEAIDEYRLDGSSGDQRVAIKVLHTAVIQRPRLFAELRREFQHLQSLSHPNIVRVHEFDRDGDLAFFTMEYLSGVLLTRVLAAQITASLHRPYALSIVRDVGAAVAHAHARGVVHGDLNPGNIFITDDGEIRVLDFGAAHELRRDPWISDFEGAAQITVATPTFASCQLLEGETADARDDLYALACIAYVLLTGNRPYRGHSALKARTLRLKPERPAGISRRQWHALRAGLEFQRDNRPTDMRAWLRELASGAAAVHLPPLPNLLTVRPPRHSGNRWLAYAAALALLAALAWWGSAHRDALEHVKTATTAKLKTSLADTVLGQLWDRPGEPTAAPAGAGNWASDSPGVEPESLVTARAATKPAAAPDSASLHIQTVAKSTSSTAAESPAQTPGGNPIHARLELASENVDVAPGEEVAQVVVRRTRSLRGDVSFNWWTESGTAKPERDFTPVKPEPETIREGKNATTLSIPIMADPGRHEPRSFYIVIDEPSDNATLGQRTLTMVTIPGNE